jgi:hypothetical protein
MGALTGLKLTITGTTTSLTRLSLGASSLSEGVGYRFSSSSTITDVSIKYSFPIFIAGIVYGGLLSSCGAIPSALRVGPMSGYSMNSVLYGIPVHINFPSASPPCFSILTLVIQY